MPVLHADHKWVLIKTSATAKLKPVAADADNGEKGRKEYRQKDENRPFQPFGVRGLHHDATCYSKTAAGFGGSFAGKNIDFTFYCNFPREVISFVQPQLLPSNHSLCLSLILLCLALSSSLTLEICSLENCISLIGHL